MAAEVNSTVAIFYDPSWATAQSTWLKVGFRGGSFARYFLPILQVVPWGFRNVLNWIKQSYNASVFVTENGYSDAGETEDVDRVVYFQVSTWHLISVWVDCVSFFSFTLVTCWMLYMKMVLTY